MRIGGASRHEEIAEKAAKADELVAGKLTKDAEETEVLKPVMVRVSPECYKKIKYIAYKKDINVQKVTRPLLELAVKIEAERIEKLDN